MKGLTAGNLGLTAGNLVVWSNYLSLDHVLVI